MILVVLGFGEHVVLIDTKRCFVIQLLGHVAVIIVWVKLVCSEQYSQLNCMTDVFAFYRQAASIPTE